MRRAKFTRKAVEFADLAGHDFYKRVVIHTVSKGRPYQVLTLWHCGRISTSFAETIQHARDMAGAVMATARDEGATCTELRTVTDSL